MDFGETFTLAGITSLVVSTTITVFTHRVVVKEVGKLTRQLADIKLVNQQILQKNAYDLENRRKAEMVAELFALWIQSSGAAPGPGRMSVRPFTANDFKRLNELSFLCAFWLPQNILDDINNALGNEAGARNIKQIMVDIRRHLNEDAGAVNPMSIRHF